MILQAALFIRTYSHNHGGLNFYLLVYYRERREAEVRELEKAKMERERLEKQRAEQAVHKHFEESLRLAQQKVCHAFIAHFSLT